MKKLIVVISGAYALLAGPALACTGACSVSIQQIADYTSVAAIQQSGPGNSASVSQSGSSSGTKSLTLYQTSFGSIGNSATVNQSGASSAVLRAVQYGDANAINATQSAALSPDQAGISQIGAGNGATLRQTGSGEGAAFTQLGANNSATVTQSGSGDVAVATQTGSGDTMSIAQSGDGDYASYTQLGDNLKDIKISQTGPNASVSVVQTAFGTFK